MDATIISCGARKIWQTCAEAGPTPAKDAYTGGPFKMARRFAEQTSPANWYILSAKYGLISPEHSIESYDASFATGTAQVTIAEIRRQAVELGLQHCDRVVVLGGAAYRKALESAVGDLCTLEFPFAGMPIGKFMAAVKSYLQV